MGDGSSILTNVSKIGSVSRLVQGQQSNAPTQEEAAKKIAQPDEPDAELMAKIERAEKNRVRDNEEERRKRRERARQRARRRRRGGDAGTTIDLKA